MSSRLKVALTSTVGVVGAPSAILSAVADCHYNTEHYLNIGKMFRLRTQRARNAMLHHNKLTIT